MAVSPRLIEPLSQTHAVTTDRYHTGDGGRYRDCACEGCCRCPGRALHRPCLRAAFPPPLKFCNCGNHGLLTEHDQRVLDLDRHGPPRLRVRPGAGVWKRRPRHRRPERLGDQSWRRSVLNHGATTQTGWTAGGGVEYALDPHWSAKVEYDYLGFGSQSVPAALPSSAPGSVDLNIQRLIGGINYRF
jgi:hypothetical protein